MTTKPNNTAAEALLSSGRQLFFLGDGEAARLCSSAGPWSQIAGQDTPAVLILPPFAEELNRSRRLIALIQDALAQQGIPSLHLDLYGTGDSAGRFADARLDIWSNDIARAKTLAIEAGAKHLAYVGIRFGATLALEGGLDLTPQDHVYAVAPQPTLKHVMRDFLRIAATEAPTEFLKQGRTAEVGGYEIAPDLFAAFNEAKDQPALPCPVTCVFQKSLEDVQLQLSAGNMRLLEKLQKRAPAVDHILVQEAPVWSQGVPEEPENLPELLAKQVRTDLGGGTHDL